MMRSRLFSNFAARRQQEHFYYFYDLKHTVLSDRLMIVAHYQLANRPNTLELVKDTLPYLSMRDALKLTMEHRQLINTTDDALQIFDLIFKKGYTPENAADRLQYAKAILPAIDDKRALANVLSRLERSDRAKLEEQYYSIKPSGYSHHT